MQTQRLIRTDQEAVYITVLNNENAVLEPGKVVRWSLGTTATQPAGAAVELVDFVVNVTTGPTVSGAPVAGVVHTTISTAAIGQLQVYGYDTVRASASLASGVSLVASSINATNIGHVQAGSQSTLTSPEYTFALVGWQIIDGPNATNAGVFLKLL
jgi:hypothetical protein